ncbi:unnamed protein product, partial [Timema podura]|nr:unnamed protein product [Timema podura]
MVSSSSSSSEDEDDNLSFVETDDEDGYFLNIPNSGYHILFNSCKTAVTEDVMVPDLVRCMELNGLPVIEICVWRPISLEESQFTLESATFPTLRETIKFMSSWKRLCSSSRPSIICSSHFWGYLADTRGRKKIIITGMVMDSFITIISSFSHAYWIFVVFKFFNGFAAFAFVQRHSDSILLVIKNIRNPGTHTLINSLNLVTCNEDFIERHLTGICASHAVNYAYLGEFHSTPTRTKAIMLCGVFSSVATVTMP